jgi:hypothetical protein
MCATEDPDKPASPDGSDGSSNAPAADGASLLSGFRRTQRVAFETSVEVRLAGADEQIVVEHTKTLNVSANGALVVLRAPVKLGQQIHLLSPNTKKEIECHVRRVIVPYAGGGMQIGVEFVAAAPDFWGMASAPADWDPAWVPPEQRLSLDLPPVQEAPPPPPGPQLPPQFQKPAPGTPLSDLVKEIKPDLANPVQGNTPAQRKRSPFLKWLIVPVAAVALFALWITTRKSSDAGTAPTQSSSLTSVSTEDAHLIPNLETFRLAAAEDFDPGAVSWLRGSGQQAGGKIPGAYFGLGESNAYVLVEKTNERRVVILAGGELRYNAEYPVVAIAARVPKELIAKINWADSSPPVSDRDGLLIVRAADSPASAVVLFLSGNEVLAVTPADYRQIPFAQPH